MSRGCDVGATSGGEVSSRLGVLTCVFGEDVGAVAGRWSGRFFRALFLIFFRVWRAAVKDEVGGGIRVASLDLDRHVPWADVARSYPSVAGRWRRAQWSLASRASSPSVRPTPGTAGQSLRFRAIPFVFRLLRSFGTDQ